MSNNILYFNAQVPQIHQCMSEVYTLLIFFDMYFKEWLWS